MKAKRILIISNNDAAALGAWAAADTWELVIAGTDEQALEFAQQQDFEAVIVDDTDGSLNPRKLGALLPILMPDVPLFHYAGESVDTLGSRVKDHFVQLRNERIRRFLVLDDSQGSSWSHMPQFSAN